jgi:hypothetical protein
MVTMTHPNVTGEQVWAAFRGTHEVRWRERYHGLLLVFEGQNCHAIAPWL